MGNGDCLTLSPCLNPTQALTMVCQHSEKNLPLLRPLSLWRNQTGAVARNTHVTARQRRQQFHSGCLWWAHCLWSSWLSCFSQLTDSNVIAYVEQACIPQFAWEGVSGKSICPKGLGACEDYACVCIFIFMFYLYEPGQLQKVRTFLLFLCLNYQKPHFTVKSELGLYT